MIKKIMNKKIISGTTKDSFKNISILMKNNNIGFMPIKENNEYIGVITDRDISLSLPFINNINNSVKSYITNSIIYVDINSTIKKALSIMSKYKVKRLLVKEKDNIVGILSLSDILNYTNDFKILNTYKAIFKLNNNNKPKEAEIDEFYL